MKRVGLERLLWLFVFWALVTAVQWRSGAYGVETVRHTDESAHLLNAVMVRDYVALGFGANPLEFVKQYYLHYPAVAPLVWPPLFHVTAGLWMLVFGASGASALTFVGLTAAAALLIFFELSRREFGRVAALLMALTLGGLRLFVDLATTVMIDMMVLTGALAFIWALSLMLDQPDGRAWRATGLAGGLWGATKANGLAALPSFGVALLLQTRSGPGWRKKLGTAAIIGALSLPPALVSMALLRGHEPPQSAGMEAMLKRLVFYVDNAWWQVGWWVLGLAAAGMAASGHQLVKRRAGALETAMLATLAGTIGLHVFLPLDHNERYLAPMLPPVLYFAVHAGRLIRWRHAATAAAFLVAVLVLPARFDVPRQTPAGLRESALRLREWNAEPRRVMVFSDERGETALVAEMAMCGPRRSDFVVRGSKMVSESSWYGGNYRLLVESPEKLAELVEALGIQEVLMDHSALAKGREEHKLAARMMELMPDRFPVKATVDAARRITIHDVVRRASPPRRPISYNLSRSLNVTVSEPRAEAR